MSFLDSLLKGFIRSTVNQIGRDTGRRLSSRIYSNQKISTPKPSITTIQIADVHSDSAEALHNRALLLSGKYTPVLFENSIGIYITTFIGSFIIPIVGPFYWLAVGIKNAF